MLKIAEDSENYACTVVEIGEMYPIPDADRIVRTVINGNDVIVSKETKKGDIVLYFCAGTQLEQGFCFDNNLYDNKELNSDREKRISIIFKKNS